MKMNSLDALLEVLARAPEESDKLVAFAPRKYVEKIGEQTIAALGELPIRHMREFSRTKQLPAALVADIRGRALSAAS